MTRGRAVLALALLGVLAFAGYRGWQAWELTQPGFHARACWFATGITGEARCGFMVVKENRSDPQSRMIRLPVVVFEAQSHVPQKEPILYLTGGPGAAAYLAEQHQIEGWWQERRLFPQGHDLIVMGQRGTGLEEPDFSCDAFGTLEVGLLAYKTGTPPPDVHALTIEAVTDCAAQLTGKGVDLTAYNSRESAADVAELRQALGIEEWTLYGISYGTRLALSALRYHPEGVRAVVLDSVFPPESAQTVDLAKHFDAALQRVFDDCAAAAACRERHGDLRAAYAAAGAWLEANPPSYTLREIFGPVEAAFKVGTRRYRYRPDDDADWIDQAILFDKPTLDELLFDALYSSDARLGIPRLLQQTAQKGTTILRERFRDYLLYTISYSVHAAVYLSHVCHDEAPFESPEQIAAAVAAAGSQGHLIDRAWTSYLCDHWPAGAADPIENTAVASGVPALLLAGERDPITPPSLAQAAAAHLSNGRAYALAGVSHGVLYESDCAQVLLARFLETLRPPSRSHCSANAFVHLPRRPAGP
ncbi:alpha/beta fold hydrolase [Pelagibius sp.]|uniref:alpha/beta fold hydrolase n=1 Tax=Pelagibius sp. TaxID=1931238 RepID=UPI00263608BD|nr:alpha/beta fold hydrolase [Pelagibius sp.]